MNKITIGLILGFISGLVSVAIMLPMDFPDKKAALAGAFSSRFLIGFFTATSLLPLTPIAAGGLIGFMVSVPDAFITKAYLSILLTGTVIGLACGGAVYWLNT